MTTTFEFQCPTCSTVITAPTSAVGRKMACSRCDQRLEIPEPPRPKTVMGRLLSPPSPTAVPQPAADPADEPADESLLAPLPPLDDLGGPPVSRLVLGVLLVVAGVAALVWWAGDRLWSLGAGSPAVNTVEKRAEPRMRKWILDHAKDKGSVTFERWGPHVTENFLWPPSVAGIDVPIQPSVKSRPAKIIRVAFRETTIVSERELRDLLFIVQDDAVLTMHDNLEGDSYKKRMDDGKKIRNQPK